MATLQVLCPNGRRQNVKITPNTKLLQVLEDVCQKQKFLPAEDYSLKHGRNTLDLTLSMRYANLSNNAKLELVKCEKSRAESAVLIALQLEGGERLQGEFEPGTTLWELLQHWEGQEEGKYAGKLAYVDSSTTPPLQPVCIYMREEVTGEFALQETLLRTLGLTGGRAVIRLLHRSVEDSVLTEIKTKIEKEKQRKARLAGGPSQQTQPKQSQNEQKTDPSSPSGKAVKQSISVETQVQTGESSVAEVKAESTNISLNINLNIQNDGQPIRMSQPPSEEGSPQTRREEPANKMVRLEESHDVGEPMEVEQVQIGENPMETEDVVSSSTETRQQPTASTDSRESARQNAVNELRDIPGIEVFSPNDFNDLPPDQQRVAKRLAQALFSSMGASGQGPAISQGGANSEGGARKKKPAPKQQQQPTFANFKFPEETKGKNLYKNEMSNVKQEDFKPCDRRTIVFNAEESLRSPGSSEGTEDLPDDFFELTERDIRSLMAEKQKQLNSLEDQPLMTASMRKARVEEMYSKYERVVIRVQFHDKLVLQGLFRPRETVFAVQKFVKEHLEDKSIPFYLYTSPPKNVLKDQSKTLIEAQLVPAAVVYFGSEHQKAHYLSSAVLAEQSSKLKADILVAECLNAVEEDAESNEAQPSSSKGKKPVNFKPAASSSSSSPASSSSGRSTGSSDKPVPKWFKIGKK
ncbi:tether containing UBX domain for GLUT4-like [Mya arenaria]|uniref:tether containing UBX domain for GLUT4-like n=1 Tax=Mya arenaria TaxID=6604 RepID=UPI0022DF3538|nr:tether containing UBX domain for GLUT4-like [Mya arenaria]